jgi:hypothetical protein
MSGLGLNSSSNFAGETFVRFKETCCCGPTNLPRARNLIRTSPAIVLQPHEPGGRGRLLRATRGGCFAVRADVSQNGVPVNEGVRHLN